MTIPTLRARRVAIFGDVHLGRPGAPTAFAGSADALAAWIDDLARDHDLIIVNGDLFDLERGPLPLQLARELAVLREHWDHVVRALDRPGVVVTTGNHDPIAAPPGQPHDAIDLLLGDARVRVEHGHRFDAPIKQLRTFASLVTWASGRASDPALRPIFDAMRRAEARLAGGEHDCPIERGAARWLRRHPGTDAIVIGHTHRPLATHAGRGSVFNPGDCVDGTFRWLTLDAASGEVLRREASTGGVREVHRATLRETRQR